MSTEKAHRSTWGLARTLSLYEAGHDVIMIRRSLVKRLESCQIFNAGPNVLVLPRVIKLPSMFLTIPVGSLSAKWKILEDFWKVSERRTGVHDTPVKL